jgi:hypothetical protein
MKVEQTREGVHIYGNVKSVSHFQEIKQYVDSHIQESDTITITLKDSISLVSSVIGYFNRLVQKDKKTINLVIFNQELYDLLDDLKLIDIFNVEHKE